MWGRRGRWELPNIAGILVGQNAHVKHVTDLAPHSFLKAFPRGVDGLHFPWQGLVRYVTATVGIPISLIVSKDVIVCFRRYVQVILEY